jgi:hypothetical protein
MGGGTVFPLPLRPLEQDPDVAQEHKRDKLSKILDQIDKFEHPDRPSTQNTAKKTTDMKTENYEQALAKYQELHAQAYEEWEHMYSKSNSVTAQSFSHPLTHEELKEECFQHRHFTHVEILQVLRRHDNGEELHRIIGSMGPFLTITAIMRPAREVEIDPELLKQYQEEMVSCTLAPIEDDMDL